MNKKLHIQSNIKHLPFQEDAPQIQWAETFTVNSQMKYNYCLEHIALFIYVESRVCIYITVTSLAAVHHDEKSRCSLPT